MCDVHVLKYSYARVSYPVFLISSTRNARFCFALSLRLFVARVFLQCVVLHSVCLCVQSSSEFVRKSRCAIVQSSVHTSVSRHNTNRKSTTHGEFEWAPFRSINPRLSKWTAVHRAPEVARAHLAFIKEISQKTAP